MINTGGTVSNSYLTVLTLKYNFLMSNIYILHTVNQDVLHAQTILTADTKLSVMELEGIYIS